MNLKTSALVFLGLLVTRVASAEPTLPAEVQRVGVEPRLGDLVPLELRFRDAQGREVRLGDLVVGAHPTLLVLAYARCTTLCGTVLRGLGDVLPRLSLRPGRDYTPLVVSLDAHETVDEAARRQAVLLEAIGLTDQPDRWPYLVGDGDAIRALADALGVRYSVDAHTGQIAHPAVLVVLTADGRIAAYLEALAPEVTRLEKALAGAAAGRALVAQLADVLRCFRFDPGAKAYGPAMQTTFRVGGAVIFTALIGLLAGLGFRARRKQGRPP